MQSFVPSGLIRPIVANASRSCAYRNCNNFFRSGSVDKAHRYRTCLSTVCQVRVCSLQQLSPLKSCFVDGLPLNPKP